MRTNIALNRSSLWYRFTWEVTVHSGNEAQRNMCFLMLGAGGP